MRQSGVWETCPPTPQRYSLIEFLQRTIQASAQRSAANTRDFSVFRTHAFSVAMSRHGQETMSMAAGVRVLANHGSAGIYTHRDGADSVEWRGVGHIKSYRC